MSAQRYSVAGVRYPLLSAMLPAQLHLVLEQGHWHERSQEHNLQEALGSRQPPQAGLWLVASMGRNASNLVVSIHRPPMS